jgi:hypothetical protein
MQLIGGLPEAQLRGVALWFGRSKGVGGLEKGAHVSLCEGVRAMVVDGAAPDDVIRLCALRFGTEWLPSVSPGDVVFVSRLRRVPGLALGDGSLSEGERLLRQLQNGRQRGRGSV